MNKIRPIKRTHYDVKVTEAALPADPGGWLAEQMEGATFLAHADDGLIWGRVEDGEVHIAHEVLGLSPRLHSETLWQLWLFGPEEELFLWREGDRWRRRTIREGSGGEVEYYDESQILWGVYRRETKDGFTAVHEGQQGLAYAVPLEAPEDAFDGERHPLRLRVRHYLEQEPESGLLRVALSRLAKLYVEEVQR